LNPVVKAYKAMEQKKQSFFKHNRILYILIGLLLVSIIYIVFTKRENVVIEEKFEEVNEEKIILAHEFKQLAMDYDSLKTTDSKINKALEKERERVAQLLEDIKMLKASNTAQIAEYKKELASLRNVMRSFVVQIDSLNARNQVLTNENKEQKKQISEIKDSYQALSKEKETLVQKVEIAARLEARGLAATGLTNKAKENNRVGRISKIRVCFTILKNQTANVGEKVTYIRIQRPDGSLLFHSPNDLFTYEGEKINYSAQRIIEYGGEDLDVCLFYNVEEGELIEGLYTVDAFIDSANVGTVQFELK
jgi:DNA repair exonuclease SbcCD ATPase subunit